MSIPTPSIPTIRNRRPGRLLPVAALLAALLLPPAVARPAMADANDTGFGDVQRYLFVTGADSATVTVIDTTADRVAGRLEVGLVPRQAQVSSALAKLVAIDGDSPRLAVVDLVTRQTALVPLDFVPRRLATGGDGVTLAVADPEPGIIGFVNLLTGTVRRAGEAVPGLRELILAADGGTLYLAAPGLSGLGRMAVASGRLAGSLAAGPAVAGFTLQPGGRVAYARRGDGTIDAIPLGDGAVARTVTGGGRAALAYPSGTGAHLVIPDDAGGTVAIVQAAGLTTEALLPGAAAMGPAFSAWFDAVAFVPAPADRKVLVYSLWHLARAADIALPGRPGSRATATPDGAKLYVPLEDAGAVAVIDAEHSRLATTIAVAGPPAAAIMAGGYGVCH